MKLIKVFFQFSFSSFIIDFKIYLYARRFDTLHGPHELLPPANEVYEGYVFTRVCHSVHGGACVVAPGGHA